MKSDRGGQSESSQHAHYHAGPFSLDATDLGILALLQRNCKQPLAEIGKQVGLSAPSVTERIHKLEDAGVIQAYRAVIDSRALGRDVTAFIGVGVEHPRAFETFEKEVGGLSDVLECHHVTGQHTLMLKVRTANTETLEALIAQVRSVPGVQRTDTTVVLSSYLERSSVAIDAVDLIDVDEVPPSRRTRRQAQAGQRGK